MFNFKEGEQRKYLNTTRMANSILAIGVVQLLYARFGDIDFVLCNLKNNT